MSAREAEGGRGTQFGCLVDGRAAGVGQAQQAADLIERLARGVVERRPQHLIAAVVGHQDQLGVAAADDEVQHGKADVGRVLGQPQRVNVSLDVVDAQQRQVAADGQPLGHVHAHQQRADQPRPAGDGHAIEVVEAQMGLAHGLLDNGVDHLHVAARGHLREHAAVAGV